MLLLNQMDDKSTDGEKETTDHDETFLYEARWRQ